MLLHYPIYRHQSYALRASEPGSIMHPCQLHQTCSKTTLSAQPLLPLSLYLNSRSLRYLSAGMHDPPDPEPRKSRGLPAQHMTRSYHSASLDPWHSLVTSRIRCLGMTLLSQPCVMFISRNRVYNEQVPHKIFPCYDAPSPSNSGQDSFRSHSLCICLTPLSYLCYPLHYILTLSSLNRVACYQH